MIDYYKVLTIAGSDSGGGAGIQADLKTISALGLYGMSAITAVTAQNSCGVTAIQPLDASLVEAQIEAVMDDFSADAIKIGMLHSTPIVEAVIAMLDRYQPKHVVLDPVMIATSGDKLITEDTITSISTELFRRATLVTPNIDEAEYLTGITIRTEADMHTAAEKLLQLGCRAVLMKGGHLQGERMSDILFLPDTEPIPFTAQKIASRNTHGTGCTLSSAIASYLALGEELPSAVKQAKEFITEAIGAGAAVRVGAGHGPLNHFHNPQPLKLHNRKENPLK